MRLPFYRPRAATETALSEYWDEIVRVRGAGEALPENIDSDVADVVRQFDQTASLTVPRADFADRLLNDLLDKQRKGIAVIASSHEYQTPALPRFPGRPVRFPDARPGWWFSGAVAAVLLLVGVVVFFMSWPSDSASVPPEIPAVAQEGTASPVGSVVGTPAAMINPDNVALIWQWDLPAEDNQNDGFDQYLRVAINADGEIFVIDPDADATIHLLNMDGIQTGTWGGPGQVPGTFNFGFPSSVQPLPGGDIDFDAEGNIYVFDSGNDRIQKFSPDREFVKEWPISGSETVDYNRPLGAVDPVNGKVYVVTENYPKVQVFDLDGNLLSTWGSFGGKEGQFRAPSDVAVAPDGTVWISDKGISRIQHFDADGNFLGMIGGERGGEPGQFNQVTGLFIDDDYNIYVADFGNGRIQVVRPDGTPLLAFSLVTGIGRIAGGYSLWVDDQGSLYVADSGDDRVLKLRLPPLTW